jgi:hypothetical protein
MTRYLLAVNFEGGVLDTPMEEWKPEEIEAHLDYYKALHKALVESGELVESEVLSPPDLAKIVTSDGTAPVVTDGPFQEFKEWLAGYQIVDVESEARAIEIAGKISAVPGPGGVPTQQPIQVRQLMDKAPADAAEMRRSFSTRAESAEPSRRCRGPAARAGAAGPWRARSQVERLRRRRGRGSGGAARRRPPLAS